MTRNGKKCEQKGCYNDAKNIYRKYNAKYYLCIKCYQNVVMEFGRSKS